MREMSVPVRASATAWSILGLLLLAYLLVPFSRFCLSALTVDIMRDLSVDAGFFGLVTSSFFLVYGIMQIPSGMLVDSLGPRRILPLFVAAAGLGSIILGTATVPAMLFLGRALTGFGLSIVFVSGIKVTANWFPPHQFARISGLFLGLGGIGMILAAGPMAYLCAILSWRTIFIAGGCAAVVLAVALRFQVHDSPADKAAAMQKKAGVNMFHALGTIMPGVREMVRDRAFWLLCLWSFLVWPMHSGFGALWGGPYLMHVHGLSSVEAGSVLSIMGIGVLTGGVVIGWLAESTFNSYKAFMILVSLLLPASFATLAALGAGFPRWGLYLWFFLLAFLSTGAISLGFALTRKLYSASRAASAAGLLNAFPCMAVFLFHPMIGYILDHFREPGAGLFSPFAYSMACVPFILSGVIGSACLLPIKDAPAPDRAL